MMRTTDGAMTMILERKDLILYFNNYVSVVRSIVRPIHPTTTLSFITLLDPLKNDAFSSESVSLSA